MLIEGAFFLTGVLPYWYTLWLPTKDARYWLVLCWCCIVWIAYFTHKDAHAAVLNNLVELGLATYGMSRVRNGAS